MKDIITLTEVIEDKPCIQSLTEHNRIYCPVCHRPEGVGLSGWEGLKYFVLKFGCKFCGTTFEYKRAATDILPSELCHYRDQYFSEALREFAVTVAGKKPSSNVCLLIYPKDASKIGRKLKIVWDRDKGGEVLEKDEEGNEDPFQKDEEDESA